MQEVLAKEAEDYKLDLLVSAMLLARVLQPDAEAVEIVKETQVPQIKLRYGFEAAILQFAEPPRPQWSKQNCEFLRGFPTGLSPPFDKVFVKRVHGQRVSGHDLLIKLTGRLLPFSPTFLGIKKSSDIASGGVT